MKIEYNSVNWQLWRQDESACGDQIEVFKIIHGIEGLDSGMFFKYRTDNRTRGHSWALAKERCKLDIRKYAFSQRTRID